jgi:Extracellular link domain
MKTKKIIFTTYLILLILAFCKKSQEEITQAKDQWDSVDSKNYLTYTQALEYCKSKQSRLPTIGELKSAVKMGFTKDWQGNIYWTSEEKKDMPRYTLAYSLTYKDSFETDKTGIKDTRCIK